MRACRSASSAELERNAQSLGACCSASSAELERIAQLLAPKQVRP
jgi:hypothetical protein